MATRLSDELLLSLLLSYQKNPANPNATAALLSALEGIVRVIIKLRKKPLGGYRDARQETLTALFTVAQAYNPKDTTLVGLRIMRRVASLLVSKVRKGINVWKYEVPLEDADRKQQTYASHILKGQELPPETIKMLLDRAEKNNVLNARERQFLLLWAAHWSYQEIADSFNKATSGRSRQPKLTAKAASNRVTRAIKKLRQWASN